MVDRPYSKSSQKLYCKACQQERMTRVDFESGDGAVIAAGILCIVGCWPCCILPFCLNECKDCVHYCSVCGIYLGKVRFLS